MKTYRVIWEIDIEADSPEQAVKEALDIQRDNSEENIATVFTVIDRKTDRKYNIDMGVCYE